MSHVSCEPDVVHILAPESLPPTSTAASPISYPSSRHLVGTTCKPPLSKPLKVEITEQAFIIKTDAIAEAGECEFKFFLNRTKSGKLYIFHFQLMEYKKI